MKKVDDNYIIFMDDRIQMHRATIGYRCTELRSDTDAQSYDRIQMHRATIGCRCTELR